MNKIVKKVWGYENWIVNRDYCGKLLILKRDFRCSLHLHKEKEEDFYIYRGKVLMEVGKKKWIMKRGDKQHISPNTLHRFTGLRDSEIIEFSSHHKESDSYRKELSGKAFLRKAYDYDGVVSGKIKPEKGSPIITGRSWEEIDRINLEEVKLNHPIYYNPVTLSKKTRESEMGWKRRMIIVLKIEEFYEDDPKTILFLERMCPNCHIVKV